MDLELTRIFVKVVQHGSFSKAALTLKMPKSTVSKAISRLEKESGTKLMTRTTRNMTLTAAGLAFYESTVGAIQVIEDAQKSLHGQDSTLTGLVRLTAPEDLGAMILSPAIAELATQHPGLKFELVYKDEIVDLVKDGFDLAVRVGRLNESRFKIKKAGEINLIPVASATYLKNHDRIRNPFDLKNHTCLTLNFSTFRERWTLKSSKGTVHVPIEARIFSNQMTSLIKMAISGGGVTFVPRYLCQPFLESGDLVRILPEWTNPGLQVSLVSPLGTSTSARLKVTVEKLLEALTTAL